MNQAQLSIVLAAALLSYEGVRMKKRKTLTAFLLAAVMLLGFTGCGEKPAAIVGSWRGEVDYAVLFNEKLAQEEIEDITVDHFRVTMTYTFCEDGTYYGVTDAESVYAARDALEHDFEKRLRIAFDNMLDTAGEDISLEQAMNLYGPDMENQITGLANMLCEALVVEEAYVDMRLEGQYLLDGDRLHLSADLASTIDPAIYDIIELDEDTLTFVDAVGAENFDLYPIVLTRCEPEE